MSKGANIIFYVHSNIAVLLPAFVECILHVEWLGIVPSQTFSPCYVECILHVVWLGTLPSQVSYPAYETSTVGLHTNFKRSYHILGMASLRGTYKGRIEDMLLGWSDVALNGWLYRNVSSEWRLCRLMMLSLHTIADIRLPQIEDVCIIEYVGP